MIENSASAVDAVSDSSAAQWNSADQGRTTISTPTKPTAMADQRHRPTRSPSIGTDSAQTSSGEANMIAATTVRSR